MSVSVVEKSCTGCGQCALCCPVDAVKVRRSFVSEIDRDGCIGCLICLDYCPPQAIVEQ